MRLCCLVVYLCLAALLLCRFLRWLRWRNNVLAWNSVFCRGNSSQNSCHTSDGLQRHCQEENTSLQLLSMLEDQPCSGWSTTTRMKTSRKFMKLSWRTVTEQKMSLGIWLMCVVELFPKNSKWELNQNLCFLFSWKSETVFDQTWQPPSSPGLAPYDIFNSPLKGNVL